MSQEPIKISTDRYMVEIDPAKEKIVVRFLGILDLDAGLRGMRAAFDHDACNPEFPALVDYRDVVRIDLTAQDLAAIGREARTLKHRCTYGALVMGDNLGRYMMAKLFCTLTTTFSDRIIHRRAFRRLENAQAWLEEMVAARHEAHLG